MNILNLPEFEVIDTIQDKRVHISTLKSIVLYKYGRLAKHTTLCGVKQGK